MGLNETYTGIRGQILMMTPLPSLNQAYSLLLQEENQRNQSPMISTTESAAMSLKHIIFQRNATLNRKSVTMDKHEDQLNGCSYCHQDKHTRDKCFSYMDIHHAKDYMVSPKPKLIPYNKSNSSIAQVSANVEHFVDCLPKKLSVSEPVDKCTDQTNCHSQMLSASN